MSRKFAVTTLAILATVMLQAVVCSAAVNFSARVDRNKIGINETVQYIITIEGDVRGQVNAPQPPQFDNFDVLGTRQQQNHSIINGRVSASLSMVYQLLPRKAGKFTIPPATFKYDKEYKSNSVEIEVIQGEKMPNQKAPQKLSPTIDPNARDTGVKNNIFFKASVNKSTAVVNEPILVTFGFYRRVEIYQGSINWPTFSGFWVEDLEDSHDVRETIVDGRRYIVEEWQKVLFPTSSGNFTIPEAKIQVQTSPFQSPYEIKTNPIKINVTDFPDKDRPDDFDGAVGRYKISANIETAEAGINEPVNLTIKVTGTGNVNSISGINIDLPPDIDTYEATNSASSFKGKGYVHGERIFEYTFLPRSPGEFVIPPASLTFFDYRDDKYVTIKTKTFNLKVTGAAAGSPESMMSVARDEVKVLKREINHIKPAPENFSIEGAPIYSNRIFLALHALPLLFLGIVATAKNRKERLRADVALARSTRAKGAAAGKLRKARGLMNKGAPADFFAEITTALHSYFADKLNVSPSSIVTEEVICKLEEKLGDSLPAADIRNCLAACDSARFSTIEASAEDMKNTYEQAANIINTIERNWKKS